jgi:hypothetical protein
MIKEFSIGDEQTRTLIVDSFGKTISSIHILCDNLYINFEGGVALRIWDCNDTYSDCRYMKCNDTLESFSGSKLLNLIIKPVNSGGDELDSLLMEFETTNGTFTIINYNSHNEQYSSFWIKAEVTNSWIPKL